MIVLICTHTRRYVHKELGGELRVTVTQNDELRGVEHSFTHRKT